MTPVLLPFFLLYLASKNILSVARVLIATTQFAKLFVLSLLVLSFCTGLLVWKRKPQLTLSPAQPNQEQLAIETQFWENTYVQQPSHRDLLVNLAILYQQQGEAGKATEFLAKARQVDPNFFTVETSKKTPTKN